MFGIKLVICDLKGIVQRIISVTRRHNACRSGVCPSCSTTQFATARSVTAATICNGDAAATICGRRHCHDDM